MSKLWIAIPVLAVIAWLILLFKMSSMADQELAGNKEEVTEPYMYTEEINTPAETDDSLQSLTKRALSSGKLKELEDVALLTFELDSHTVDSAGNSITVLTVANSDAIVVLTDYPDNSSDIAYTNKYGSDLPIIFGVTGLSSDKYSEIAEDIGSAVCAGKVSKNKLTIKYEGDKYTYRLEG